VRNTPSRFVVMTALHSSRGSWRKGVPVPERPAFAKQPSRRPKSATVAAIVSIVCSSSATSQT
jgi:hypothetical protein